MKLIGLMPVRNEDWCLGLTLRAALRWCDEIVVLLHASTDNSRRIISEVSRENPFRLAMITDEEATWNEMPQRQRMLEVARKNGATHIALIDADELLTCNMIDAIKHDVCELPKGWLVDLPGYNLRGGLTRYHANGIWSRRWFASIFVDAPNLSWTGDKFHQREPSNVQRRVKLSYLHGDGGVLHLWGVSERRLRAKHRLYKMVERLRWPDRRVEEIDEMYSWATKGRPGADPLDCPERWRFSHIEGAWLKCYESLMPHLSVDATPWQEEECVQLLKEHGPAIFRGLDLS